MAHVHNIDHMNTERYSLLTGVNFWMYLVMGVQSSRVGLVPGL